MRNTRGAVGSGGCGSVDFGDIRVRVCEIESISYFFNFLIHSFHLGGGQSPSDLGPRGCRKAEETGVKGSNLRKLCE